MQSLTLNDDRVLCIYHEDCVDGFLAAWVVGRHFGCSNVEFVAAGYERPVPDLTGRNVYIVDFSYKPHVLIPELTKAASVTIIDHHKTSLTDWTPVLEQQPQLREKLKFYHNLTMSGAMLTWALFNANTSDETKLKAPVLFHIVQDYDLYKLAYTGTEQIIAAIKARGILLHQNWQEMKKLVDELDGLGFSNYTRSNLVQEGQAVLRAEETFILNTLRRSMAMVRFAGYTVPMCAMPHQHATLAGSILQRGHPFSITYEDLLSNKERKFSLRSDKDTGVDVEQIARLMGGGGHSNSSGFSVPLHRNLGSYIQFL